MSESLETLRGNLVEVLNDQNTRYRGDVKLSQLHRNEWPALWEAIDAIVAWWPYDPDGEDEDELPETEMEATYEGDDLVSARVVGEAPAQPVPVDPGESIAPAVKELIDFDEPEDDEEFYLPERHPGYEE
jgi:hypothetical protein